MARLSATNKKQMEGRDDLATTGKPAPHFDYKPPDLPLRIIHHDKQVIVVSKPSGLLSVPGKDPNHADCLEKRVQAKFAGALTVHRLDRDTSGICVMAQNADAHRNLSMQFQKRKTEKVYNALVWGDVAEETGEVELPLRCDWPNRPRQMVDHEFGKNALTRWQVMERQDNMTRMRLEPVTGRSHQLRVHMAELGHPILGDRFYAEGAALTASDRLMLHAQELSFHHPEDGSFVSFVDPAPF